MLRSQSWKTNLLFFCCLLSEVFGSLLIAKLSNGMTLYPALVMSQLLIHVPIIFYLVVTRTNPFKLISFKFFNPLAIITVVLMTYCLLPVVSLVNVISLLFVKSSTASLNIELTTGAFGLNFLFVAVMPAVSEELAFRGVFYHSMKDKGIVLAVFVSALMFGMMHLNFNQFSYTFVIGIAMALAVYATGSIFASMLVHLVLNGNSVILLKVLTGLSKDVTVDAETMEAVEAGISGLDPQALLGAIILLLIVSAILIVPAIGMYLSTLELCGRREAIKELRADCALRKRQRKEDPTAKRRVFDIFLILDIAFAMGYMIYRLF